MENAHYVLLSGPKPLLYTKLHAYYNCSEGKVCVSMDRGLKEIQAPENSFVRVEIFMCLGCYCCFKF